MSFNRRPLAEFEKLLLDDPFNTGVRKDYALNLMGAEQYEAALKQVDILLKDKPSIDESYMRMECLYELDRFDEARLAYKVWRELSPDQPGDDWDKIFGSTKHVLVSVPSSSHKVIPFVDVQTPKVSFASIIGMEELKEELRLKILAPMKNPELFAKFQKSAGGGVLLYGPPGCGKTMFAEAIATECNAEFISVGISDVLNMWLGQSEQNLSAFFARARSKRPSVLFFDELDALGHSRSKSNSDNLRSLVNEFLSQLDGFNSDNKGLLLLAATNMPWDVDGALKRPGRFSRQIFVPPPDADARAEMFRLKMTGVPHDISNFQKAGQITEFYSGADIDGVIDLAKETVLGEILRTGKERNITDAEVIDACKRLLPSTKEWLNTVKNIVKYGGADAGYPEVEVFLKKKKLL